MYIDPNGHIKSKPSEAKLSYEERIEYEHKELMHIVKPLLRSNPLEYEQLLKGFERHDITRAQYRLYALTRGGYFPDTEEKKQEIGYLQKLIGDFEMTMVDWSSSETSNDNEDYDGEYYEEDDQEIEPDEE